MGWRRRRQAQPKLVFGQPGVETLLVPTDAVEQLAAAAVAVLAPGEVVHISPSIKAYVREEDDKAVVSLELANGGVTFAGEFRPEHAREFGQWMFDAGWIAHQMRPDQTWPD